MPVPASIEGSETGEGFDITKEEGLEEVRAGETEDVAGATKEVATDSVFRSRLIFATSPRSVEKSEVSRIAVE